MDKSPFLPKVVAMGVAHYKSGEPGWHHNCSSKWCKSICCLLDEEWWGIEDVSRSTLSEGSPEPAPQDEEGEGANPEGAPASMDVPEASTAPILVTESMIAMVISTSMGRDQGTGAACVLTVTTSLEIMNLEAPSVVVGHQVATVEELAEEDLVEGCP